jgi:hypothetical protein
MYMILNNENNSYHFKRWHTLKQMCYRWVNIINIILNKIALFAVNLFPVMWSMNPKIQQFECGLVNNFNSNMDFILKARKKLILQSLGNS